jgi:predicted PurR-regulated permease PerM
VNPRDRIRAWLPHAVAVALAAAAALWLLAVVAPVRDALLVALGLAMIGSPVLYLPVERLLLRTMPGMDADLRRWTAALLATIAIVGGLGALTLVLLGSVLGSLQGAVSTVVGLAVGDTAAVDRVAQAIAGRAAVAADLWPQLGLDREAVADGVRRALADTAVGPAVLHRLATGAGGLVAELALVAATLFYLFACGPWLAGMVLRWLPLDDAARAGVAQRVHATALHLLVGVGARAVAHGLCLGLLAWAIGGWSPLLVGVVATAVAVLPVVGPGVAWFPLAAALWGAGNHTEAALLAVTALLAVWLVERGAQRIARRLGSDDLWLAFLVFISLVGGLIGWGVRGLVIGPAAVLAVTAAAAVVEALYRRSGDA